MGLFQVTPQTLLEGVLRKDVLKRVLREGRLGITGTATGGDATSLIDTVRLLSARYTDKDWEDAWVRISKDAGGSGAAPQGEIQPASAYSPSAGDITTGTFTAAIASGDLYEVWRYPHPQEVLDILDSVLTQETFRPEWCFLSELPDYDFEAATITDNWGTASGASAAYSSTAPLMHGKKYAVVTDSGSGNGYLPTDAIAVEPNRTYCVSALVRGVDADDTAQLIAYDETNSAAIDSKTCTKTYMARMGFTFTTPSTCKAITIRLASQGASDVTHWDDVVFYELGQKTMTLPWWVRNRDQVKGVFELRSRGTNEDSVYAYEMVGLETDAWDIRDTFLGRLQLVRRDGSGMSKPLFIFGTRPETAYSNDHADTKYVNEEFLVAATLFHIYDALASDLDAGSVDMQWIQNQRGIWKRRYDNALEAQDENTEKFFQSPRPDVVAVETGW